MRYTIGAYSLDVDKPFKSVDEAVKFVQKYHPELSREEIEDHITPKIKDDGADHSSGIGKEAEESGKGNAKVSKGRADKVQHGTDKSK
ncbi:hypothetical protein [uncultured Chryseobacterium sp.]|uniref:hypothetical protein n=1 Tax=uncultured Chryseobacterium sp. TaxID=259322 RepID=UPI0025EF8E42|nr:hypothetical protein [uncultured Chryseobacterium sp.]